MSGATSKFGLPYPTLADAPNVPSSIQSLAQGVDALGAIGGKRQTSAGAVISTVESIVVDTQTLAMPAANVYTLDFFLTFTVSVAGTDLSMKIRMTNVSGTILGECATYGVYVSPEQNRGFLRAVYKTTTNAELNYFAGTIVRIAGTGTATPVAQTSLIVTNLGPSTIIGDF